MEVLDRDVAPQSAVAERQKDPAELFDETKDVVASIQREAASERTRITVTLEKAFATGC
jgi:hypothetical protein